jgi:hypothetical protein
MKADRLLSELEDILTAKGFRIRRERGSFRNGNCLLQGEKLIMLNKVVPPESQIASICLAFEEADFQDDFIKPAVRKELERYWQLKNRRTALSETDLSIDDDLL